jgi:hypothetical protein
VIEEVEDLRGVFVKVGDTIAYAATDGRSGGLRVGTVLEIIPEHDNPEAPWVGKTPTKIRVEVSASSGYWAPAKPTLIQASFKRFVRIG